MKKKLSLVLALTIFASAFFAGCNFNTIENTTTTDESAVTADNGDTTQNAVSETEIISIPEEVTDAQGVAVTNAAGEVETTIAYYSVPVTTTQASQGDSTATTSSSTTPTTPAATTQPAGVSEVTTEASQAGQIATIVPGKTEYDILRSGSFYMNCNMTTDSETLPMEVAITPNTVFMTSQMEGVSVGVLVDAEKKVYMILTDKKCYLELSDAVMNYMGMSADDLVNSDIDFSKYPTLDKADAVNDVTLNGTLCKEYVFKEDDGEMRVYLNGSKMLRYANYTSAGKVSTYADIISITGTVPTDKCTPPSGYKAYKGITGLIGFMSQLTDIM